MLSLCVMHIANGMTGSLWAQVELPLKVRRRCPRLTRCGAERASAAHGAPTGRLQVVQTAAALEIVHAILRLVRSSPFAVFLQVWSRIYVLWFLANLTPEAQEHWSFTLMCTRCCWLPAALLRRRAH